MLLLGVDRFINEGRAVTNLIDNGVASVAVARWGQAFDAEQAAAVLDDRCPTVPAAPPPSRPLPPAARPGS